MFALVALERNLWLGSLAGAAHLLDNTTGALRQAHRELKSLVDCKQKCLLIRGFSSVSEREIAAYRSFNTVRGSSVGGVRKVTTGITGLWQPSAHSDVAF